MTPATERWVNERLSLCGLGPVDRDEDFWAQMWAHAINAAEGEGVSKSQQHNMARYTMVRAIETLYFGEPQTEQSPGMQELYDGLAAFPDFPVEAAK